MKKSMYKNTVIKQKDSVTTCIVARGNGSIYWSDMDITRGKQKKLKKRTPLPGQAGLTAPTDGRKSM